MSMNEFTNLLEQVIKFYRYVENPRFYLLLECYIIQHHMMTQITMNKFNYIFSKMIIF